MPYSNVEPKQLTNQMAREILEVLIPRQRDVFLLGNVDWENVDKTQNCSCSKWFARYTNERFKNAQDVRNYVRQVYTGDAADWWLNYFLDGTLDVENEVFPCFHEHDGILYRSYHAEGKGLNEDDPLFDTTRIVGLSGDVVMVELYGENPDDEDKTHDSLYQVALCKTTDGWRTYSDFLDGILL